MNLLRIMENKFSLLDHAPLGIFVLRNDYVVLFWNRCLEDWSGVSRKEIVGANIETFFPHLVSPRYIGRISTIFEGGPPVIFSSQFHKFIIPSPLRDGQLRIQHTTVTPIPTEDDDRFDCLFVIQDVTDLTRRILEYRAMRDQALAEAEQRRQAETRLRLLYKAAVSAMKTNNLEDILLNIIDAIKIFLLPDRVSVILQDSGGENWTTYSEESPPVEFTLDDGIPASVIKTGQPILISEEQEKSTENGVVSRLCVPIQLGIRILGVIDLVSKEQDAFKENDIQLLSVLASQFATVLENIRLVENLESEVAVRTTEIREEKEKNEAILDSAGDAIALLDPNLNFQYINQAFTTLTGYTDAEIFNKKFHILFDQFEFDRLYHTVDVTIQSGDIWRGEVQLLRKNGQAYDAALTVALVKDERGNIAGLVASHEDISIRKELERARTSFMTNVSHQLRTPVANIKLYIQMLRRGVSPDKINTYYQVLENKTELLNHLVQDILEITSLDSSLSNSEQDPIKLGTILNDIQVGYQEQASSAGLTLNVLPLPSDGENWVVIGNTGRLDKAIGEVVENAILFTPSGGAIEINPDLLKLNNKIGLALSIKDTGVGIPPQELDKVFDRFFRGKIAESGHIAGTGLGLSIAQEIIRAHGGCITVKSSGVAGEGSEFTIWLPVEKVKS